MIKVTIFPSRLQSFDLRILLVIVTLVVLYPTLVHSLPSPSPSQQSLNGLYTPTNADGFFEQGRQQLEQEINHLNHPKTNTNNLLTIQEDVSSHKQILEQQQWLWDLLDSQNNLPPQEKD